MYLAAPPVLRYEMVMALLPCIKDEMLDEVSSYDNPILNTTLRAIIKKYRGKIMSITEIADVLETHREEINR